MFFFLSLFACDAQYVMTRSDGHFQDSWFSKKDERIQH